MPLSFFWNAISLTSKGISLTKDDSCPCKTVFTKSVSFVFSCSSCAPERFSYVSALCRSALLLFHTVRFRPLDWLRFDPTPSVSARGVSSPNAVEGRHERKKGRKKEIKKERNKQTNNEINKQTNKGKGREYNFCKNVCANSYHFIYNNLIFYYKQVGQCHGVQFSQWSHFMANV